MPSSRPLARPLLLVLSTALAGCYHFHAAPRTAGATGPIPHSATQVPMRVAHSFAWGLVEAPAPMDDEGLCNGNGFSRITAHSNLGFTLLTVATLGFWMPMTVEFECAADSVPVVPSPAASPVASSGGTQ
jgi:hypothetical protein